MRFWSREDLVGMEKFGVTGDRVGVREESCKILTR